MPAVALSAWLYEEPTVAFASVAVVTTGAVGSTETWLPLPELAPISRPPTTPTTELVIVVETASV